MDDVIEKLKEACDLCRLELNDTIYEDLTCDIMEDIWAVINKIEKIKFIEPREIK